MNPRHRLLAAVVSVAILACTPSWAGASSHREAPAITKLPKVDGTDFYMFRSYEHGRSGYVTLLANYEPFQDPQGGPNFYMLDPDAVYAINIDNDGDAREDISFQFRFRNTPKNLAIPVGGKSIPVPILNLGEIGLGRHDTANLNVIESYSLQIVRNGKRGDENHEGEENDDHGGESVRPVNGDSRFLKPADRIGDKSIKDNDPSAYPIYANDHIYEVQIPGCSGTGRVFVGQRREGFVIDVAETFDLFNMNLLGPRNANLNDLAGKSITTLALEVPTQCLARPSQPILGAWTTASVSRFSKESDSEHSDGTAHGRTTQVSRLSSPLVNEVVIGLPDKDRFNESEPSGDARFLKYVTNPTVPAIIQILFPQFRAPTLFPRTDLVQVFLTGVPGLNQPPNVVPGEMLRLNTSIAAKPASLQKSLGVLDGDTAGFPNGRRPGDDVVDIELRVLMGALLPAAKHPTATSPSRTVR